MPERIRLRRTRGWRLPAGAVVVSRPSRWGNPHAVAEVGRAVAVQRYRDDLLAGRLAVSVADVRAGLAGRDLACWCPPGEACHADVLLEVANAQEGAVRSPASTDSASQFSTGGSGQAQRES